MLRFEGLQNEKKMICIQSNEVIGFQAEFQLPTIAMRPELARRRNVDMLTPLPLLAGLTRYVAVYALAGSNCF
jgi:hypothetical protein